MPESRPHVNPETKRKAPFTRLVLLLSRVDWARAVFVILVVFALAGFILGIAGWIEVDHANTDVEFRVSELIYRTGLLFVFDTSTSVNPPGALDLARFFAACASAGAIVTFVVIGGQRRLHRFAAGRRRGHHVVIGPVDRVRPFLEGKDAAVVVHCDQEPAGAAKGVLHVQVDWSDRSWLDVVTIETARQVTIATGNDQDTVQVLGYVRLRLAEQTSRDTAVRVEIDDVETAMDLARLLCKQDPDLDVAVVCRPDLSIQMAAETVALAGGFHFLVCGDSPEVGPFVTHLAQRLQRAHLKGSAEAVPELKVSDSLGASGVSRRSRRSPLWIDLHAATDLSDSASPAEVIVVLDSEEASSLRSALRFKTTMGNETRIFVPVQGDLSHLGIETLATVGTLKREQLLGVFELAARARHEDQRSRLAPSDPELPAWDAYPSEQQATCTLMIRRVVAQLFAQGLDVVTADEAIGIPVLSNDLALTILSAAEIDFTLDDLICFPLLLEDVGLSLVDPQEPITGFTDEWSEERSDLVEVIAKACHEGYLAEERARSTFDGQRDTHQSWDDLSELVRAQNRDQARHLLLALDYAHLEVVPLPTGRSDELQAVAEDLVEKFAPLEHDRWIRRQWAQGYRYGKTRCNDLPDRRHNLMVSWQEINSELWEKDAQPLRMLPKRLRAAGWAIVPRAAAPSGARPAVQIAAPQIHGMPQGVTGEPAKVFVSYAAEDAETVEVVVGVLRDAGFAPVYMGKDKFIGEVFNSVYETLAECAVVVAVVSDAMGAATLGTRENKENWIVRELIIAEGDGVPIVPYCASGGPELLSRLFREKRIAMALKFLGALTVADNTDQLVRHVQMHLANSRSESEMDRSQVSEHVGSDTL